MRASHQLDIVPAPLAAFIALAVIVDAGAVTPPRITEIAIIAVAQSMAPITSLSTVPVPDSSFRNFIERITTSRWHQHC